MIGLLARVHMNPSIHETEELLVLAILLRMYHFDSIFFSSLVEVIPVALLGPLIVIALMH